MPRRHAHLRLIFTLTITAVPAQSWASDWHFPAEQAYITHNNLLNIADDTRGRDMTAREERDAYEQAKSCVDNVDRARAAGAPAQFIGPGGAPPIEATVIRADCQRAIELLKGHIAQADAAAKAKSDAFYAPYTKVLSGDKLIIAKQYVQSDGLVYGLFARNHVALRTPEELAKAQTWYYATENTNDYASVHWEMNSYKFSGMKMVELRERYRNGVGHLPPPDAYKD